MITDTAIDYRVCTPNTTRLFDNYDAAQICYLNKLYAGRTVWMDKGMYESIDGETVWLQVQD